MRFFALYLAALLFLAPPVFAASGGGRLDLLSNASATGSTMEWMGGKGIFIAEATWGGGTVKLQAQSPNGTWIDVPSASLTANGIVAFDLPRGQLRGNVTTATAVYAYAVAVPQ
jgi:hypothetical protein